VRRQQLHITKEKKHSMVATVPSVLKPELPFSSSLSSWQLNLFPSQSDFMQLGHCSDLKYLKHILYMCGFVFLISTID